MKGMRTRGNLVGIAELIVRIVKFVNGFVVTICEDCGFTLMRVMVRSMLGVIFGMNELGNIFGDRVQRFLL